MEIKYIYFLIILNAYNVLSKVYDKCDLAQELIQKDKILFNDVKTWLCIIEGESTFNTKAHHHNNWDGSEDHGLFQINDRYWCDPQNGKPTANVCSIPCEKLRDDDITDDISCAKLIFHIHGFNAWAVHPSCKNEALIKKKFLSIFQNQCQTSDFNLEGNRIQNKALKNWIHPQKSSKPLNFYNNLNVFSNNIDNNLHDIQLLLVNNELGYIIENSNPTQENLIYYYV